MKRYVTCGRVSSLEQLKTGRSVEEQLASQRTYVEGIGGVVLDEIVDDCSGTIPIRERPGGARLYRFIDHKLADGVVFDVNDRVGRDKFAIDALTLLRDLQQAGMEFHLVSRGQIDYNNPADILLFFIEGQRAGDELKTLVDRLYRRGRLAKAKRGELVGHSIPYGFQRIRVDDKHKDVAINESEAAIIRRCRRLILHDGVSMKKIAARLTDEGVPLPHSTRPRTTSHWHPSMIQRMFRNPSTSGRFSYAGIETFRPDLVILAEEERAEVLRQITANRIISTRNSKQVYQLSGRIRCACGRVMTGMGDGGTRTASRRYRCIHHIPSFPIPPTAHGISTEAMAWDWLSATLDDWNLLQRGIESKLSRERADEGSITAQLKTLERAYLHDETELGNMARRMGGLTDLAADAMTLQMNALSAKLRTLKAEIKGLRGRLANMPQMPDAATVQALAASAREKMNTAEPLKRKALFALLDVQIKMSHFDTDFIYYDISSRLVDDVIASAHIYTQGRNYANYNIEGTIAVPRLNNWRGKRMAGEIK